MCWMCHLIVRRDWTVGRTAIATAAATATTATRLRLFFRVFFLFLLLRNLVSADRRRPTSRQWGERWSASIFRRLCSVGAAGYWRRDGLCKCKSSVHSAACAFCSVIKRCEQYCRYEKNIKDKKRLR